MAFVKYELTPDQILSDLGSLTPAVLDELPFGAIELDPQGTVLNYNRFESQFAGRDPKEVIGRNFFTHVAPCTRVKRFQGAFEAGVERKDLNEVFDFTFHFPEKKREVRIRMLYTQSPREGVWIFVTPLQG